MIVYAVWLCVSNFCVKNKIGRRKREGNREGKGKREKENKAFGISNGQ